MSSWKTTLHLGDLFEDYRVGRRDVREVAGVAALRLQENWYFDDLQDEWEELISVATTDPEKLQVLGYSEEYLADDLDRIIDSVRDFGDEHRRIWVETLRTEAA